MNILNSWSVSSVLAMGLMLIAAAMLVLGVGIVRRLRGQSRTRRIVDHALASRQMGG
ncbi:MAG TPA: type II secretion protein F, partial [Achromobacter sp.]|nr:type II secretion protein F [Achromobacter sp.]